MCARSEAEHTSVSECLVITKNRFARRSDEAVLRVGSQRPLIVRITVRNNGDDAHQTRVLMSAPEGVSISATQFVRNTG